MTLTKAADYWDYADVYNHPCHPRNPRLLLAPFAATSHFPKRITGAASTAGVLDQNSGVDESLNIAGCGVV
jgi:hypothetical protein